MPHSCGVRRYGKPWFCIHPQHCHARMLPLLPADAADAAKSPASMAMSVPSGRGGGGLQLGEPPKTMTWGAYGTTV